MASSQVEIALSSSPFGYVLRDHNGRENRYKKKNANVCIQENLKDLLVQSYFSASQENADNMTQSQEGKDDTWAKAREIVLEKEPSRAVSSLLKKWRDFEADSKHLNNNNYYYHPLSSPVCSSRSNSGSTFTENSQFLDVQIKNSYVTESDVEKCEATSMTDNESVLDSESDRMGPSRDSNSTEKERMRVADIIKKLKFVNKEECNEQFVANVALPKVRTCTDHLAPEIKGLGTISATPRLRGRRAFNDMLMQMEHERHQEIERLGERKAVSKFPQRGRLQALLKVRFLLHGKDVKDVTDVRQVNSQASDKRKHLKGSSVMHLRERFNTASEQNAVCPSPRTVNEFRERINTTLEQNAVCPSPRKEVINNNTQDVDKSSAPTQLKQVVDHTPNVENPSTATQLKEVFYHTPNVEIPSTSTQLKEVVHHTPTVENPSTATQLKKMVYHTLKVEIPSTSTQLKHAVHHIPNMKDPSPATQLKEVVYHTPKVETPTSTPLKEVVHHTPKAENPSTSTQCKEEIHPSEVTHPESPRKIVVDATSNVETSSTCNNLEVDVNQNSSVVYPASIKSLKDIINSWEQTHFKSLRKNVANETLDMEAWSTSDRVKIDISRHDVITPQQNTFELQNTETPYKKATPDLDALWKDTAFDTRSLESQKSVDNAISPDEWKDKNEAEENVNIEHKEATPNLDVLWQDTAFDTRIFESQKSVDNATSPDEWKDKNEAQENVNNEHKEATPNLDALCQDTAFDTRSFESQKSAAIATSPDEWKDKNEAEENVNNEQSIVSLHKWVEDNSLPKIDWKEQSDRWKEVETCPDWRSNFSQPPSEWEEDQSYQTIEESTLDWIHDVSRPRSDWEYLRQERYQEMLDPFNENGDIKKLLERKTVSSFLSGGLRDTIDQLMISRTQGQPIITDNQQEQVKQEEVVKEEVVREEEKCESKENEEEEGGVECYPEEEEEDDNLVGRQHCEDDEYSDHMPSLPSASPDIFVSWSRNQDISNDSVASPSLQKYNSFNSPTLENQQFSSLRSNHPSIEMEFMSDLRGHMEQLHKEIFDLRKSLHSCMEMQMNMQHFMMREFSAVRSHSAENKGTESINTKPRKGTCRLCCDAEVDSLLYRCGHMCTCYKCAHELQQHSGKCPICQAPILDIVRTYTD